MDGAMNHLEVGVTTLQTFHTTPATMGGAVVHDPEHPSSGAIGLPRHDLGHQTPLANVTGQLVQPPAGQRHAVSGGQFAGRSLNLHDQCWGKKTGAAPVEDVLPTPPGAR